MRVVVGTTVGTEDVGTADGGVAVSSSPQAITSARANNNGKKTIILGFLSQRYAIIEPPELYSPNRRWPETGVPDYQNAIDGPPDKSTKWTGDYCLSWAELPPQ
jgi:hypothetical protein